MRGNVNMNEQNNSYCRACVAFFSLLWFSLMMCIVYPGTRCEENAVLSGESTDGVDLVSLSVLPEDRPRGGVSV